MAIPDEPTVRRAEQALGVIRVVFKFEAPLENAFIGLAFVLACLPYHSRALTMGALPPENRG